MPFNSVLRLQAVEVEGGVVSCLPKRVPVPSGAAVSNFLSDRCFKALFMILWRVRAAVMTNFVSVQRIAVNLVEKSLKSCAKCIGKFNAHR